ncbi:hypothetical protein PCANC_00106 [Puccinia coronata f. sp. avenae]|uniref:Wax synthase domain-containing protein n=2 Tax=Puccinia coronata f. sp. avenae TaxID=200324 RepID=A0A2N5W8J8_9BASI|nr:hypothetical protein PCANC_00106 [Puccinia coronata f. sp. avenae]
MRRSTGIFSPSPLQLNILGPIPFEMVLDSVRTLLAHDPLIKTYTRPLEVIGCESVSTFSLLYLLPSVLLAGTLYPKFSHLRSLRWIRLLVLMPWSVYTSLRLPVDYCFTPTTRSGYPNLALACASFTVAARSFHWGLLSTYKQGKIFKRTEFLLPSSPTHSSPTDPSTGKKITHPNSPSSAFSDWLTWTLELVSSPRGIQYEWGVRAPPSRENALDIIKRMYKMNLVHVVATGYSILCRDHGSPTGALRSLVGFSHFYGERVVAEGLASLAFGYFLVSQIDLMFGYFSLLIHLINLLHRHLLHLPEWMMRSCDTRTLVPMFNSPHAAPSLAHLWGKAWHQNFRQSFLIVGGSPAATLARTLGLNPKLQRLAGMLGCFVVSAILHEYALHFIARQPHPSPHILFHEFPGSAVYFLAQPVGILVEPFLLPYLPRGGGVVWCYLFTLVTTIPFRKQYFMPARLLDHSYPPLSRYWILSSLLIPGFTSRR